MAWTPEQLAAITARGASVVVSAAAGSGKTSVLTERIAELLSDPDYPAEKMVVVTFTRDAAGEVRTRLNRKLTERILAEPENAWLRRQHTMLQSAHISTIHSFCFSLMREQFAALDISAGFRQMDETEEPDVRAAAVRQVLEEFSARADTDETAKAEQKLLFDAFCTGDDRPLEELILSLFELADQTPFGEYLLDDAARAYETDAVRQQVCAALTERLNGILSLYARAAEYAQQIAADNVIAVLQDEMTQIEAVRDAVPDGDLARLGTLMQQMKGGRLTCPKKQPQESACIKALRKITEIRNDETVQLILLKILMR